METPVSTRTMQGPPRWKHLPRGLCHGLGRNGTVGHLFHLLVQHIDGRLGLDDEVTDEHSNGNDDPAEALPGQHLTQIITGGHKATFAPVRNSTRPT